MDTLSALTGAALVLAGAWLWPTDISDYALSAIPLLVLLKATLTVGLCGKGTQRLVGAFD